MQKLLIALPLLALASIGALCFFAQHNLSASTSEPTFDTWQRCFQSLPLKFCDQLTDATELSLCYAASYANAQLVWDGASQELSACVNYYSYFKTAQSGDILNKGNYYYDCFFDDSAVAAAKKSDFFFN